MSVRLQSHVAAYVPGAVAGRSGEALRRLFGVGPFLILGIVKIALVLLISTRIRPRALELL